MPAVSKKQQAFFGAEIGRAERGEKTVTGLPLAKLKEMARKPGSSHNNAGPVKDMQLTADEAKEMFGGPDTLAADSPKFPPQLLLHLDEMILKKLEIEQLPPVGQEKILLAHVVCTKVMGTDTMGGDVDRHIDIQITKMGLTPVEADEGEEALGKAAKSLYGG